MTVQDKIRSIREIYQWTQEDMAEKMNLSTSTYSKIERGETQLNFDKLQKIAEIFGLNIAELISDHQGMIFLVNDNSGDYCANYYASNESVIAENEKLKLILAHKDELLAQKDKEIKLLEKLLTEYQKSSSHHDKQA